MAKKSSKQKATSRNLQLAKKAGRIGVYTFAGILILIAVFWLAFATQKTKPKDIVWGLTWSKGAAGYPGVNPDEAYLAMLDELKPQKLRLVAYWTKIEPERGKIDYSDLDFQVAEAEKRGIPYMIAVGRRVPRYPECFTPDWAKELPMQQQNELLLDQVRRVVERYDRRPGLQEWQVENEAYLHSFGVCPPVDEALLDREIELVRTLTNKPIVMTDSGELSFWWNASKRGDVFGSTLYRKVLDETGQGVNSHIIPPAAYTARANIIKLFHPNIDRYIVAELQAEPWADGPLHEKDQAYWDRTMSLQQFKSITDYTKDVGPAEAYYWGAEWWYYAKQQGNPSYWDEAARVFAEAKAD